MHNKFVRGVKFWTSWGVAPTIFKITQLLQLFSKIVSKLTVIEGIFETKFQGLFFLLRINLRQVEDHFRKCRRSIVILKIVGATPQLVQNLTPIRKLFCTFLY